MPEQQYVSKVVPVTPKGARPKILKTPMRDSPNKIRTEIKMIQYGPQGYLIK